MRGKKVKKIRKLIGKLMSTHSQVAIYGPETKYEQEVAYQVLSTKKLTERCARFYYQETKKAFKAGEINV